VLWLVLLLPAAAHCSTHRTKNVCGRWPLARRRGAAMEEGVPPEQGAQSLAQVEGEEEEMRKQMRKRKFAFPHQGLTDVLAALAGVGDMEQEAAGRLWAQVEHEHQQVRQIFDKLDRDRDGHLNFQETVGLARITGCVGCVLLASPVRQSASQ
jgi:hypothetical protein